VADLVAALCPFLDVPQEMSGAAYPKLSMVLPILDGLQHVLQTTSSGLDVLRDVFKRFLSDKFGDTFSDEMLCAATAIDPHFKLCVFDSDARRERAREATLQLMQKKCAALTATTELATDDMPDNEAATQSSSVETSTWSKLQRAAAEASSRLGTTDGPPGCGEGDGAILGQTACQMQVTICDVLGIDRTFNLSAFYATVTVFT